jgi:hypothetical protein
VITRDRGSSTGRKSRAPLHPCELWQLPYGDDMSVTQQGDNNVTEQSIGYNDGMTAYTVM